MARPVAFSVQTTTLTRGQMAVFIVTGLLNELLPAGIPVNVSPTWSPRITGQNT
jgi:hypothetical protein